MALTDITTQLGMPLWSIAVLSIWAVIWKGLALWKSARLSQPIWFVVLLFVNTFGILEILYVFIFSKISFARKSKRKKRR